MPRIMNKGKCATYGVIQCDKKIRNHACKESAFMKDYSRNENVYVSEVRDDYNHLY